MFQVPYLSDRRAVADATALLADFGAGAAYEAAARAGRSRDVGNHIHFCHWRQIERLIAILSIDHCIGTIH